MKTQLAIEATKDILFEYDVTKDTYSSNGTICDWTRKDVYLEHFKEYVRAKNWRTEDFSGYINGICAYAGRKW